MTTSEDQIRDLLTYERALNTSDADLAASCYTPDGIFVPTTRQPSPASTWPTATARSSRRSG